MLAQCASRKQAKQAHDRPPSAGACMLPSPAKLDASTAATCTCLRPYLAVSIGEA